MFTTLLSLLFIFAPVGPPDGPVAADSVWQADTTLALAELTVTATRIETTVRRAPSRLTVLGPGAAERSHARSVAELLDDQSPAFIRRYGPGGLASLSLRGAGSSQSLVLLDGQRIADPQMGQLDLNLLPAALFQSVELVHGAGSALYGSDAMGGVVNLRTPAAGETPNWTLTGTAGAFGERSTSGRVSAGSGNLHATGLVEYAATEGNFPYVDEAAFPPETRHRTNADAEHITAYGSIAHEDARQTLRLSGWYSTSERGLPGTAGGSASEERQHDDQLRLWSSLSRDLATGSLRLSGLVQHAALRYIDPGSNIDQTGRTLASSLEAEWQGPLTSAWTVSTGVETRYQQASHPSLKQNAWEGQGAAVVLAEGAYESLRLSPSLRADTYLRPANGDTHFVLSPRLGANWQIVAGLHAKASAGRSFRMPTFNDRHWQPGGNPDLHPERGWSADAGVVLGGLSHRAEITAFARSTDDQIVWHPTPEGHWSPSNIQETQALGLEASYHLRQSLPASVTVDGSLHYTFTDARDVSNPESSSYNQQLRYVPPHHLRSQLTASRGPLSLDLTARYTGRRYITTDGSQHLDPHAVLDAQLRWSTTAGGARLQLGAQVRNLLDTQYAVLQGYPMPPRHLRLHLTLTSAD